MYQEQWNYLLDAKMGLSWKSDFPAEGNLPKRQSWGNSQCSIGALYVLYMRHCCVAQFVAERGVFVRTVQRSNGTYIEHIPAEFLHL